MDRDSMIKFFEQKRAMFAKVLEVANIVQFGVSDDIPDWGLDHYELHGENVVAVLVKWPDYSDHEYSEEVEFPMDILLQWNYTDLALELHEELNG